MSASASAGLQAPTRPYMTSVDRTRLKQLASLKKKPVHQWDVHEVCIWVEDVGLPQHRKRFAHHVVDGKLLLKLTDANLKADLGIDSLGHRECILGCVAELKQNAAALRASAPVATTNKNAAADATAAAQPSARVPDHLITDEERENRIVRLEAKVTDELVKAAQLRAQAKDILRSAKLHEEEAKRIRGHVTELRSHMKSRKRRELKFDKSSASVPWRATGDRDYAMERDAPILRTDPSVMTFKPKISKASRAILAERLGEMATGSDFLSRLKADLGRRETKLKELKKRYAMFEAGGADTVKKKTNKALDYLRTELNRLCGYSLPPSNDVSDEVLGQSLDNFLLDDRKTEQCGLKREQVEKVSKLKSAPKKRDALAGYLMTKEFIASYYAYENGRAQRRKELVRSLKAQEVAGHTREAKIKADEKEARKYFKKIGLGGKSGPDGPALSSPQLSQHIEALLERANDVRDARARDAELPADYGRDALAEVYAAGAPSMSAMAASAPAGPSAEGGLSAEVDAATTASAESLAPPALSSLDAEEAEERAQAIDEAVELLASLRRDEAMRITAAPPADEKDGEENVLGGDQKQASAKKPMTLQQKNQHVAFLTYRAIRSQAFLAHTAEDLRMREMKIMQPFLDDDAAAAANSRKFNADEFMDRYEEDLEKRRRTLKALEAEAEMRRKRGGSNY